MVVELQAAKYGLQGLPKANCPYQKDLPRARAMMLPVLVLIFCVAALEMSTPRAGFWAIVTCL